MRKSYGNNVSFTIGEVMLYIHNCGYTQEECHEYCKILYGIIKGDN